MARLATFGRLFKFSPRKKSIVLLNSENFLPRMISPVSSKRNLTPHRNLSSDTNPYAHLKPIADSEWHGISYSEKRMFPVVRVQHRLSTGHTISIRLNDITQEECDVIVNAANAMLKHSGGLANSIVSEGGFSIQEESDEFVMQNGLLPVGGIAVTKAGTLKAKCIIHAVGPIWKGASESEKADSKLREAIWNALMKAKSLGLTSIAIPAISSGIYGYPKSLCASVTLETAKDFCEKYPNQQPLDIRLTLHDEQTVTIFENTFRKLFSLESPIKNN